MKTSKTALRLLALVIVLSSLLSLSSCGGDRSAAVMTLGNEKITENVYKYWVCSYKATFMNTYSDMSDTDEFWNTELFGGVTAEKYLSDLVKEYVKNGLVTSYLFGEFGMKLSSEDRKSAEDIVSDLCEYSGGGKNTFNALLAQYGVNYDMLIEIYLEEYKSTYLYNYVFENGIAVVDDAAKQKYLEDNYSRVRQIYINNAYDKDESYYDDDGNFVMKPLDAETQKKQDEKVEKVKELLAGGADFDEVYDEYSEEKEYPNGYYLCVETQGLPEELIVNSRSIEVGEEKLFTSKYGFHAIRRMEMDDGAYGDKANSDFFEGFSDSVYGSVFADYLAGYFDKIETDDALIDKISIRDALPNYSFQY